MNIFSPDYRFALYVFLHDYHSGQNSRGYRLLSKISVAWDPRISDTGMQAIRETEEYNHLARTYANKV